MINNPVRISTGRVDAKANVIADRLSRCKTEAEALAKFTLFLQEFP